VIRWFADHPTASNLLVLLLVALGLTALPKLQRETFPDFTPQEVQIQIPYPGASAEDVEEAICLPLEDVIDAINDVDEVRCEAREGLGSTVVKMREGGEFARFLDERKAVHLRHFHITQKNIGQGFVNFVFPKTSIRSSTAFRPFPP